MMLIVGLGNPGPKHAKQRHNIGFMAVDEIVRRHNMPQWQKKFSGDVCNGLIQGQKVIVLKPMTFMNLSGQSVGQAARFYDIAPKNIIVIHDELDLPSAKIRVKTGGGHGGHNGLKSIDAHLGKEYQRVRMGIDHPGDKHHVNSHVLGDFSKTDQVWLQNTLDDVARYVELILAGDVSGFMNKLAPSSPTRTEAKIKAKSHIHQAQNDQKKLAPTGPMAAILAKLLNNKE